MSWLYISVLLIISTATFSNGLPRVRRLAGGKPIEISEMPSVVALRNKNNLVCGGVIISPTKILTTASCASVCSRSKSTNAEDCLKNMTVVVGSSDLSRAENIHNVKSVKIHEKFIPLKLENDLGVITLKSEIKYSDTVQPISLASDDVTADTTAIISGWGRRSEDEKPGSNLSSLEMKIISKKECSEMFQKSNDKSPVDGLCAVAVAGSDKAGLCAGDSGNPLIQNGKLVGIATWGIGCAEGYPDVFENVYKHLDFIKSEMNQDN